MILNRALYGQSMNVKIWLKKQLLPSLQGIVFLFSLNPGLWSCQTISRSDTQGVVKEKQLIETNLTLCQSLIDQGKPANALHALEPTLELFPENLKLKTMLGMIHLALKNNHRAVKVFTFVHDQENSPSSALNLSSAYIAEGSYKKAQKILEKFNEPNEYKHQERIYHNIAVAYEKSKNPRKAIHYYQKALSVNPTYYLSILRLGYTYLSIKNKKEAQNKFELAHSYCMICFEPIDELASLYINNGKLIKSINLLEKYLKNKELNKLDRKKAKNLKLLVHSLRKESKPSNR